MKKLLIGMIMMALPIVSSAVTIDVSVSSCGALTGTTTDSTGDSLCGDMNGAINKAVNADLPSVNIDKYGEGISNATAFALKGQSSDYAENFTYFVFKPSFGLAVDGDIDNAEQANGIGLGGALSIGLNLDLLPVEKVGPIEMKKLDLFVSFMSYSIDQSQDNTTFEGDLSSFGIFARYRFLEGKDIFPGSMLEWGGIHIHTGFQRAKMGIKLIQSFEDQTVDAGGATATFGNSSATFAIDSQTTSIPLEVSTYLRMLYVFTLYGGLGMDYTMGSTDIDLDATGSITAPGGYTASIAANEGGSGDPKATNFRSFVGLQFNIPFVRVYVHANKAIGSDLLGVNAGVKITY